MTGFQILELALDLVGIRMSDGRVPETAKDLTARSLSLLNILISENSGLDNLLREIPAAHGPVSDLGDALPLTDRIAFFALPYGLCAMLMATEDTELASFMQSKYISAIAKIKSELPAECLPVKELY